MITITTEIPMSDFSDYMPMKNHAVIKPDSKANNSMKLDNKTPMKKKRAELKNLKTANNVAKVNYAKKTKSNMDKKKRKINTKNSNSKKQKLNQLLKNKILMNDLMTYLIN